jgi:hypothetical protein
MENQYEPLHIVILAGMFIFAFVSLFVLYRVMKKSPLFSEHSIKEPASNVRESSDGKIGSHQ